MKKFLKVTLIIALVLLGIFLLDQGLRLILDAQLNTCRKAYEKLEQANAHYLVYDNDELQGKADSIPIRWSSVEREFKAEKDKEAHMITFYSHDADGCCGGKLYSKHIFAYDADWNMVGYCVIQYEDPAFGEMKMRSKKTYKVCCFDKETCTAE